MHLLEYEAKMILQKYNISVPKSTVIARYSEQNVLPCVVKSQVPVGGRGKVGGVVVTDTADKYRQAVERLFLLKISGFLPKKLLVEEKLLISSELYLSVMINKNTGEIDMMAGKDGGIAVEDNSSGNFLRLSLSKMGACAVGETLAEYYDLPNQTFSLQDIVENLYRCFIVNEALLIEINPLVYTTNKKLVAGDAKISLDSSAAFRHPEWDFENSDPDVNFVVLNKNGNVATIANGAGLAMATVDAVQVAGMTPANFLDIGGGASTESVTAAFEKIMAFGDVKAIVINIFAGITRCDEVAKAIVSATKSIPSLPPLFIRLSGTGSTEATAILKQENIDTLTSLELCISKAQESLDE